MSKRKCLSIWDKIKIIEDSKKPNFSRKEVEFKYGIAVSTISKLLKDQDKIIREAREHKNDLTKKKMISGSFAEMETQLYEWFCQQKKHDKPMNGTILREHAKQIGSELNPEKHKKFSYSDGWFHRFKKRFHVSFKLNSNNRDNIDESIESFWVQNELHDHLKMYNLSDIFMGDETGLYYRGLPDRHEMASKSSPLKGNGIPKDRVTILLSCNMDGSEKLPPLVIGKTKNPLNSPKELSKLPVDYYHNENAWMTSSIFRAFLQSWDERLRELDRSILYIVDSCSAHPNIDDELTNINLQFIPPNFTSLIQQIDVGLIPTFKYCYRSLLVKRIMVDGGDLDMNSVKNITLLDAIYMAYDSWALMTKDCISTFFKRTFKIPALNPPEEMEFQENQDDALLYNDNEQDDSEINVPEDFSKMIEVIIKEEESAPTVEKSNKHVEEAEESSEDEEEKENQVDFKLFETSLRYVRRYAFQNGLDSAATIKELENHIIDKKVSESKQISNKEASISKSSSP